MGKKTYFEIILGTYEEFVLGYKYVSKEEELVQTFADHGHTGSVRSVAQAKHLIASGGADDRIVIYDFKLRMEHRMLMHHNGTVNCLEFTNECTHLISGSEDGVLAFVRVGNWMLEKIYEKAHNGSAILDIAIHPSSKLALSLGADRTLRTWNLVKGRLAYTINLNSKSKDAKSLHTVKWAPDGVRFILIGGKYTDIWSIDTGGIITSYEHKTKVTSCIWKLDSLIVGYEDGDLGEVNIESGEISIHKCHDSRVKCLAFYGSRIISASSSGEIKILNKRFKEVCSIKAGCRFTSMCIIPPIINEVKNEIDEQGIIDDVVAVEVVNETLTSDADETITKLKKKKKKQVVIIEQEESTRAVATPKSIKKKPRQSVVVEELENSETIATPKSLKKNKKRQSLIEATDSTKLKKMNDFRESVSIEYTDSNIKDTKKKKGNNRNSNNSNNSIVVEIDDIKKKMKRRRTECHDTKFNGKKKKNFNTTF